eukprot:4550159-Ditylum_brightwellii.AAC.1
MAEAAQYAMGNTKQMFSSASAMQCCQCDFLPVSAVTVDVVEAASLLLLGMEEEKLSCGDGASSDGDDYCKPAEWA